MIRLPALWAAGFALALGVSVTGQDGTVDKPFSPSREFQDVMKSNAAIAPVDGAGGTLIQNLDDPAENFEAIVKDAETLKGNFAKLHTILAELKVTDALKWAEEGELAVNNLRRYAADAVWQRGDDAAMLTNRREMERARIALADACRGCHIKHRVYVIAAPIRFEIKP